MSSKRAIRRRACQGKQRYADATEAGRALVALHLAKGYQGFMTVYRCQFCRGWHYGHPPAKVRAAIKGRS